MNDIRNTGQYVGRINPSSFQKGRMNQTSGGSTFQTVFQTQLNEQKPKLQFSKHATMRLADRNIHFTQEQIDKIEIGIDKAEKKGVKDSLVLIDQVALVVNVKNRIVVTAVDQNNSKENIYTNIDGAVLL